MTSFARSAQNRNQLPDSPYLTSEEGHERPIDGGLDESAYPPIATVSLHRSK